MEIEPLLLRKPEEDFTVFEYTNLKYRENKKVSLKQDEDGVELIDMGQPHGKINKIHDWGYKQEKTTDPLLKLNIQEILDLKQMYKRLARLSPEDEFISKRTFLHYFPLEGSLGERLFKVFDTRNDDHLNIDEFLSGVSLCLRGTMSEKCHLLFNMFDMNGDEGVSQDELFTMLKPTLKAADSLSQKSTLDPDQRTKESEDFSDVAKLLVHEAFEECDLGQSGKLSVHGFQKWLGNHKELVKAIFNLPFRSVMRQNKSYEELDAMTRRNNRLRPQTWMNEYNENDDSSAGQMESTNLKNAKYLWSPLFPQASSKFPPSTLKHAAVLYRGCIYVFGGRSKTSTLRDVWVYSLAENLWRMVENQNGSLPPALHEHTAILYKNYAYIFGGAFASDDSTPFWRYCFEMATWKNLNRKKFQKEPLNRKGHSAVVYRDCMYIFGGYLDNGVATNEIWKYNFGTFRWHLLDAKRSNEVIPRRYFHSAVVHDNSLWVFGGVDSQGKRNDLWKWNFELSTWVKIRCKGGPTPIAGHTCSKIGCLMVLFGGEGTSGPKNETWSYSFETAQWKKITPFSSISPTVRSYHVAIELNPYSVHNRLVRINRPTTTKSAPDTKGHSRQDNLEITNFQRVQSAESIVDYHTKRVAKGKSLDLSFELDNNGYEHSFPDVSNNENEQSIIFPFDSYEPTEYVTRTVGQVSETSLQQTNDETDFVQNSWSIVVIGGKGKFSADLYKTAVDIWKCDIGPDIGSNHHIKSIVVRGQIHEVKRLQNQTKKPSTTYCVFQNETETETSLDIARSIDNDQLFVTDLTNSDESERASPNLETRGLLTM